MSIVEKGTPPKDEEVSDTYESQVGETYPGNFSFLVMKHLSSFGRWTSKMASLDILQCPYPGSMQPTCARYMGSNELPRRRRRGKTLPRQCSKRIDIWSHGNILLPGQRRRPIHRHKVDLDHWNNGLCAIRRGTIHK